MVEIINARDADFDQLHLLLKSAFQYRSDSRTAIDIPSPDALAHKYLTTEFPSKIAVHFDRKSVVAMNGLTPIPVRNKGVISTAWMSCDTATHPNFQGQGFFKRCVLALEESLSSNELIFGFPNQNSMPGFEKLGWKSKNELKLKIAPRTLLKSRNLHMVEIDLQDYVDNNHHLNGINKNSQYLSWRYNLRRDNYQAFRVIAHDFQFEVITKKINLNGVNVSLVLEISKFNPNCLALLRNISIFQNTSGILVSTYNIKNDNFIGNGFFSIPKKFNPRPIILSGKTIGDPLNVSELKNWSLSLGDFDAL